MKITTFGLDLAKRVFQLLWVDVDTGEIIQRQLKREQVFPFFANRPPAVIAMESCGSSHYWARKLMTLGHEVRLLATQFVRPFVKSNKTDAADSRAIWEAAQQPGMNFVAVKSEGQQSVLMFHRMREQLVRFRTMQVNQMRGLLYEFGVELPQGRKKGMERISIELGKLDDVLPALVIETLHRQLQRIASLDQDIVDLEQRLTAWKREDSATKRLMGIPGVGLLSATAEVAMIGDASTFKSGREFAAFLGLVPRLRGTGGRVKLLGISKRGDVYLRTLLIHGARVVITRQKKHEPWLDNLLARRPLNKAVVAQANKMARTIWALLAHDRTYQTGYAATPV